MASRALTAELTGTSAAVAVRSYMELGNLGARFDRARVAAALLSGAGRAHLTRALRRARPLGRSLVLCRAIVGRAVRSARRRRGRRPGGAGRVGTASAEPARTGGGR